MAAKASVEDRLVGLADLVIEAAKKRKDPVLDIPVRALSNVEFNPKRRIIEMKSATTERTFFNLGMAKKFMQTLLVADALAELQRQDLSTSLREIYYRTKHTLRDSSENTFDGQDESDPIIEHGAPQEVLESPRVIEAYLGHKWSKNTSQGKEK